MLYTKAVFRAKEPEIESVDAVVEKVIRLSGAEFDRFSRNLMRDWDFIRDNRIDSTHDNAGRRRCLLIVGEGRRDGILVDSSGYDYARYSAFMPNAGDFLIVGQYPALAALNEKLAGIVGDILGQDGKHAEIDLYDLDRSFHIDLTANSELLDTVLSMVGDIRGIDGYEINNNILIINYGTGGLELSTEDLSDPAVTRTDMYAYGYGWEGMIPLGKDRALELFDKGHEVFRLYENDAEGAAGTHADIETFDGLFGIEDPTWDREAQAQTFEVFILNREKYDQGEASGEWLTLPTDAGTLRGLFERIGIDRPNEGAFTITAVRLPDKFPEGFVSKYDSIDELNMLASYLNDMEDFEHDKLSTILTSGIAPIGNRTGDLINLLSSDNFDAFDFIDVPNAEALGRHTDENVDAAPDGISFEEYGLRIAREEGGVFTGQGYLYFKYGGLLPEYTGVVPDEYRIIATALQGLRQNAKGRPPEEKPSVLGQIRAAKKAPQVPKYPRSQKKNKGGPEL